MSEYCRDCGEKIPSSGHVCFGWAETPTANPTIVNSPPFTISAIPDNPQLASIEEKLNRIIGLLEIIKMRL